MTQEKQTTKEADEILAGASDYASGELAGMNLSDKHKDRFKDVILDSRTTRRIRITGNNVAKEYYKETGRNFDNDDGTEAYARIIAMILIYAIIACTVNLILYIPVYYLLISWGDVNRHDAVYITLIINTAIGTISTGIWNESNVKRIAFIAGMHAEADDHIVSKYHEAREIMNKAIVSKGDLPYDDHGW